jgi:diacylglycerol kinase
VLNATHYSLSGLAAAARHEDAFRQKLMLLIVELLNSAVEATVDRISFENHRLAKRAKDIGSAAVMLSLANARRRLAPDYPFIDRLELVAERSSRLNLPAPKTIT